MEVLPLGGAVVGGATVNCSHEHTAVGKADKGGAAVVSAIEGNAVGGAYRGTLSLGSLAAIGADAENAAAVSSRCPMRVCGCRSRVHPRRRECSRGCAVMRGAALGSAAVACAAVRGVDVG